MDVARRGAGAVLAQAEWIAAAPADGPRPIAAVAGSQGGSARHLAQRGEHDDLGRRVDVARLTEQREREAGRDPEATQLVTTAPREAVPVVGRLMAAGRHFQKIALLVERAVAGDVLNLE